MTRTCVPLVGLVLAASWAWLWAEDPIFEVDLDSTSYGGASIADLDGDGAPEILFGTYYNDERVVGLNGDGSVHLQIPSGGGPVDNSVTVADLNGDGEPEILWGNSGSTWFHCARADGTDIWTYFTGEVLDAPEAVGDVNGDGQLDIVLASCGSLRAFTGYTGALLWTASVSGCYQSAPLLFDQDGDGLLDVVVSVWGFSAGDNKVRGFSGLDGHLLWEAEIGSGSYHAGSFGDLNDDGVPDVAIGDNSGAVWVLDGTDGELLWTDPLPGENQIFGPTAMGDLDGDGALEVVVAGQRLWVFDRQGNLEFDVPLQAYCSRGPVLVDTDGDTLSDILVATDVPAITVYSGLDGSQLYDHPFAAAPPVDNDHHPAVADIDGDGTLEVFTVYGRGYSVDPQLNWGKAVLLDLGAVGAPWPTFSHDHHHSGNDQYPPGAAVNEDPCATSDLAVDAGADQRVCADDAFALAAAPSGGVPAYAFSWTPPEPLNDPTSPTPAGSVSETTTFWVTVEDHAGCTTQDTVTITVRRPLENQDLASWRASAQSAPHLEVVIDGTIDLMDFAFIVTEFDVCLP